MARTFIDLSIFLENDVITDRPFMQPKIKYMQHHDTMPEMGFFFSGVSAEQVPGGEGFAAAEVVTLSTHNGTHLDAPWHFHPTQDGDEVEGGRPSMTIDEGPLEWCFQPDVKLDFRHFEDAA
jgi:kynurenine formamidase